MSAFAARGYGTGGQFHEEEGATVAYSGPHLAELIAASGETPAITAFAVSVESTVVIPGSRSHTTAESIAPVSMASTSTRVRASASSMRRNEPTARVARRSPSRTAVGWANALALGAAALFFGMLVATSLGSSPPRATVAAAPARHAQKHELSREKNALSSPLHTKAVVKRAGHAYTFPASGVRPGARTATAAAPLRTSTETDDAQLAEGRQVLLAAQLERSL
jgi:hypothetical protein